MRCGVKQKQLQLPTKFSDVVVGLANPGWQTVPEPATGNLRNVKLRNGNLRKGLRNAL